MNFPQLPFLYPREALRALKLLRKFVHASKPVHSTIWENFRRSASAPCGDVEAHLSLSAETVAPDGTVGAIVESFSDGRHFVYLLLSSAGILLSWPFATLMHPLLRFVKTRRREEHWFVLPVEKAQVLPVKKKEFVESLHVYA
jgi:hypothetical protein